MTSALDDDSWTVLDHCSLSDREFLSDRINDFNVDATGISDGRELAIVLRDADGSIFAGIYGWTWGGFCEIDTLWVEQRFRRQGLGTRLLQLAEQEARRRGASQLGLDTHSFQAPDFYAANGYSVVGRQDDYPIGHAHIFFSKRL